MSQGDKQIAYFRQAIEDHGDCFYGDGVQVGASARLLLAYAYLDHGDAEKAAVLFAEIRKDYSHAIDHSGHPLIEQLPPPAPPPGPGPAAPAPTPHRPAEVRSGTGRHNAEVETGASCGPASAAAVSAEKVLSFRCFLVDAGKLDVLALAFSPDGKTLAASGYNDDEVDLASGVTLWDVRQIKDVDKQDDAVMGKHLKINR